MRSFAPIALAVSLISIPGRASPEVKTIVVEGLADIRGERVAQARRAAIRDAQRAAVEQTAGVHVQTLLSEDAFSVVRADQEKFSQEVTTKFVSQSKGTLRKSRVIKECRDGALYKVTLEVEIDDASVARDLRSLARSMARARSPKLMLAIKETYTGKDGKTIEVEEPAFLTLLEDALLARGFDLVSRGRIAKLRSDERAAFADLFGKENVAARVAMSYEADYLVNGVAKVQYTSHNDFGLDELHGTVELTLRTVSASTAAVISSITQPGDTPPCYSEPELRIRGVQHVGPKVVDNLVERILESWKTESRTGARYVVKVVNLPDYQAQVMPFLTLLEHVPEASKVKQLSYGGGRLEVEVFYPASRDASTFTRALIEAANRTKAFHKLNVAIATGRDLNLRLGRPPAE